MNTGKGYTMNLLNRAKINVSSGIVFFITLILGLVLVPSAFSGGSTDALDELDKNFQQLIQDLGISQSSDNRNNVDDFSEALQAFSKALESDDEETLLLLKKWNDYLIKITDYSNDSYIKAMRSQQADYYDALEAFGNRITQTEKEKKEYSSSWIDDLINHFGKDFIKENQDSVKSSLRAIFASDEVYKKELKDLIYTEAMLFGSYRRYYGLFSGFYNEKLDKKSQKKLETRKNLAEAILKITAHKPLTFMHDTTGLQKLLAENDAQELNDEVYIFLKNHPLSYTFSDLIRELEDFNKAIDKL